MTDPFDRFLSEALAPPARDSDRGFVARVSAAIALDEAFRAERRATLRALASQALALLAVAAGLLLVGRAAPVADFFAESPWAALATLLSGFGFLIVLFASQTRGQMAGARYFNDLGRLQS